MDKYRAIVPELVVEATYWEHGQPPPPGIRSDGAGNVRHYFTRAGSGPFAVFEGMWIVYKDGQPWTAYTAQQFVKQFEKVA